MTLEFSLKGLCKGFGGTPVLDGVNLDIPRGEFVAVVGGSGCGKTVLMKHILGLLDPDAGSVRVADHDAPGAPLVDVSELSKDEEDRIHTHWGVVFQQNALFSGTVFDNIALWLEEIKNFSDAEVLPVARRVLELVALPSTEAFLDTDVGSLSGGMAKRLATARALAMDPKAIFYDEPTTGLDPASAAQIQDLLLSTHEDGQASGRTTVVITHDKDLLRRHRPRIVMLHAGKVHFDGSFPAFEAAASPIVRPYFDLMPVLQQR